LYYVSLEFYPTNLGRSAMGEKLDFSIK